MRWFPTAATCLAAIAVSGAGGALAQQSTEAIIDALKPTSDLTSVPTRSIKPGGAANARDSADARSASIAASNQNAEGPAQAARPSVNLTVNFPAGSAELTPAARASLDALGQALASSDLANFRFRIEGHTDNVGSREVNRTLSQRRAEAVVSYLTSQYNVAPARLEAVGMGQERPLIETPPQTPEVRNRRVQVINLGA
jgi:outer membrane protein OmpA-like peptidoglycan-associated protein